MHVYGLGLTLCVKVNDIYENLFPFQVSAIGPKVNGIYENLFPFQVSVIGPLAYIHVSV